MLVDLREAIGAAGRRIECDLHQRRIARGGGAVLAPGRSTAQVTARAWASAVARPTGVEVIDRSAPGDSA